MADAESQVKTILFVGPTGCGKGTQAKLLSEKTGYPVFSTGDRYREIRDSGSSLGNRIRDELDAGHLMPGWLSAFLFEEALLHKDVAEAVICEGVGRTLREVELFEESMRWLGRSYTVIFLQISEEESIKRQLARGRNDSDTEEKLHTRFRAYQELTMPAIEYFRSLGKVIDIDGERSVEEIHADVLNHLGL